MDAGLGQSPENISGIAPPDASPRPDGRIPLRMMPMTPEDIPELLELEKVCFDECWTEESYRLELKNKSVSYYLTCRQGEKMAGFVGAWFIQDEVHITTIGVSPDMRGMRAGKMILWCLIIKAIARCCRWVTLEVSEKNAAAIRMYESFGFTVIGRRKSYYNKGEDAIVMWVGHIQGREFHERMKKIRMEWEEKICLSWE